MIFQWTGKNYGCNLSNILEAIMEVYMTTFDTIDRHKMVTYVTHSSVTKVVEFYSVLSEIQ